MNSEQQARMVGLLYLENDALAGAFAGGLDLLRIHGDEATHAATAAAPLDGEAPADRLKVLVRGRRHRRRRAAGHARARVGP